MKVTFLITINLDALYGLNEVAESIANIVDKEFDVVSVKAWARPTAIDKPVPVSPKGKQVLAAFGRVRAERL